MSRQPPSVIPNSTSLELMKIFRRIREILTRSTGTDDVVATLLRIGPVSELFRDPIMRTMYNRGMDDWTAGVNLVYDPRHASIVRSLVSGARVPPINGMEYCMYINPALLFEHDTQELHCLRYRGNILLQAERGFLLERIAAIVRFYPLDKIRSDPLLFAAYIRGWEDQKAAAAGNNFLR